MKEKSIKKNIIYNILFQFFNIGFPLIMTPYVSRVLGTDGVGIHNYTYSLVQYFIIAGALGTSIYGNRQIAYTRDDKKLMSKNFWSIFAMKAVATMISLVVYLAVYWNREDYLVAYRLQVICIIASLLDISWLFMGLEEFKKTITRSMMIKILMLLLVFCFIRKEEDIYLYILFNGCSLLLSNLILWIYLPKTVNITPIGLKDITAHLKPSIMLFIPQIAVQVYVLLDKTFLGALSTMEQVALYTQSEKLIKAGLSVVSAVGTAMLPRMSNIFAKGDKEKMNGYLNITMRGLGIIGIGMSVGMMGITPEFAQWFLGSKYIGAERLMIILAPIIVFMALSNIMGVQYLIPSNRTNEYTIAVTMGAVLNVVFNVLLIPKVAAVGACVSTVVAEGSVMAIEMFWLRREIAWKDLGKELGKALVAAAVMLGVCRVIGIHMGIGVVTTLIQVMAGGTVFCAFLLLTKTEMATIVLNTFRKKVFTKK